VSEHSLIGKAVVIGGGAKNLGGLISRDLATHGADAIAIHYNSAATKAAAEETVATVKAAGADAFAIPGDLTKVAEVTRLFDEAMKRFGHVDIAVNTTGMVIKKPIAEVTEEDYDKIFAINSKRFPRALADAAGFPELRPELHLCRALLG
jgi:NAD(P)-dependent dehydrogenase (short-subunit alcohol dehydrogenase family)